MKARLIRLYPLYLLGSLIGIGQQLISVGLHDRGHELGKIAVSIAFTAVFLPSPVASAAAFPFVPAAWSLFYELAANAVYGFIARWGSKPLYWIVPLGAALLVATCLWHGSLDVGAKLATFAGGVGRVVFGFFAGREPLRYLETVTTQASLPVWVAAALLVFCFWYDPGSRVQYMTLRWPAC